MKNEVSVLFALRRLAVSVLLAATVAMAAMPAATGAGVEIKRLPEKKPTWIEISGGSGRQSWTLRYGTYSDFATQAQLVPAAGNRTWFTHGGWLRLIDTEKGLVTGRWHFPDLIVQVVPVGNRLQIVVEDKRDRQVFRRTLTFEPGLTAAVPYWPSEQLSLVRVPITEASGARPGLDVDLLSDTPKIPAGGAAKELVPELEEAVRRDPTTPWRRVALWRLLHHLQDARASAVLAEALRVPTTDFTELLPIAGLLDRLGEREAARAAFERGFQDFIQRGNDPRLALILLEKIVLYRPWGINRMDPSSDYGRELIERNYRLAPHCEAADLAWEMYADYLEKNGRAEEARLWRARAREAAPTSVFLLPRGLGLIADRMLLLLLASFFAGLLFLALLSVRYWHQRRADWAASEGKGRLARAIRTFEVKYWSRSQRFAFLTIVLAGWIGTGVLGAISHGIQRGVASPLTLGAGSLAAPGTVWYLENRLPSTPERDLFLALAYQQSGEKEKAERLYRRLSGFAEAWNNLGVLLKESGENQQAQQAFREALRLDPNLAEAALNLGQAARTLWTELHQKYAPGQPMLAPPQPGGMWRMFLGGSWGKVALWALLAGPFATVEISGLLPAFPIWFHILFVAALVFALALFLIPVRPVTQSPPRIHTALEVLFPGIAPQWCILGGLALTAWTYFLAQGLLLIRFGTPYIMTSLAVPSLGRAYGVSEADISEIFRIINPSWTWLYGAPLLLFAVNLVLVLRAKLRRS